jgi:hypothetical protein
MPTVLQANVHWRLSEPFAILFSTVESHVPVFPYVLGCRGLMLDGMLEKLSASSQE